MIYAFYLIVFLLGLGFGSFLNVLAMRYDPNRSVFAHASLAGRSYCPYCHKILGPIELVPVLSFILQRGRCRSCGHKLSLQYPAVELLSGLIFIFVPLFLNSFYGVSNAVFANFNAPRFYYGLVLLWVVAFWVWLLIGAIDYKRYLIPNELNWVFVGLAIIFAAILLVRHNILPPFHDSFLRHYALIFSPSQNILVNHLFGGLFGLLFYGILTLVSRGRAIGLGDVKLATASGLLLGWPDMALATALAFVVGGAFGGALLFLKKKTMHSKIPFAPFLVLGFALTFFFGYQLIKGYFGLFNL